VYRKRRREDGFWWMISPISPHVSYRAGESNPQPEREDSKSFGKFHGMKQF
jgi:hypothetical protein